MKYFKLVTCFLVIFVFFSLVSVAHAMTVVKPENNSMSANIESGNVVNDNLVIVGGNVEIRGQVNGDVIVFGQTVKVSGKINGSLFAFAATTEIDGEITDDAFIGSGAVTLSKNAKVDRDLICGSGSLAIDGQIGRNVLAGSGNLSINGNVSGNVTTSSSTISIADKAVVGGSLVYYSQKEMSIKNLDKISGGVNFHQTVKTNNNSFSSKFGIWILGLAMSLVLGLLLLYFFPKRTKKVAECVKESWLKSLGIGLLMFIIIPIIAFILMVLVIGLPAGLILLAVYLILIYTSKIWVSLWLGRLITGEKSNPYWSMILGLVILYLLYLIPVVGPIIAIVVIFIGLGGLYRSKPLAGER